MFKHTAPNAFNPMQGITSAPKMSLKKMTKLLKTSPEALEAFEKSYHSFSETHVSDNYFRLNSRQAAQMRQENGANALPADTNMKTDLEQLSQRIVDELIAGTPVWRYDGTKASAETIPALPGTAPVELSEIQKFPKALQPELSGNLIKQDITEPSYPSLLWFYDKAHTALTPAKRQYYYHMFRQGLDILDLDPVTYEMLSCNQNSMGYWLPRVVDDITATGFFKVPKTTIIKVPLPILQLGRYANFTEMTPTSVNIVNKFVDEIVKPDEAKSYFIKTGTYSSKFDFRNAQVPNAFNPNPAEVHEIGSYLMFIHQQANQMASPLTQPASIYGASTTNEWVIREFIEDKEDNLSIYHGMPLHTEYRVFVDFDTKEVLGINPYWDPEVMAKSLHKHMIENFADIIQEQMQQHPDMTPDQIMDALMQSDEFIDYGSCIDPDFFHDAQIFDIFKDTMMERYNANKDNITDQIRQFLQKNTSMTGQWSMDIMQNGDDFWFIDMAAASTSALSHCVPAGKLKVNPENWIPDLQNLLNE